MGRVIQAFAQFFNEGVPLSNGWLSFLVSGTNNTPKDTYSDPLYQTANPNPIQLDADGRCPNVFGKGDYRVVSFINDPEIVDSPGEMLQVFDPVSAQSDVGSSTGGGTGYSVGLWDSSIDYTINSIVERDLNFYKSLIDPNLGLDPLLESYAWEHVKYLRIYNATISYNSDDLVAYDDNLWLSLSGSNQNNTPTSSPVYWRQVASGFKRFVNSSINYNIPVSERDSIVMLTPVAAASATFTLPSLGAAYDLFRVSVYNASNYDLYVTASGTASFWISSSGSITIAKGCFAELIYNSYSDTWVVIGNVGPALGGQNIGSETERADTLYIDYIGTAISKVDEIHATSIGTEAEPVDTIYSDYLLSTYVGKSDDYCSFIYTNDIFVDDVMYIGSDLDILLFVSGGIGYIENSEGQLVLGTTGADNLIFMTDLTYRWTVLDTGHLRPYAVNTYDIGTTGVGVRHIYQGTNCYHYLGDSQQVELFFNGHGYFRVTSGDTYIFNTGASNYIRFGTNNTVRWVITDAGTLMPVGSMDLGGSGNRINNVYLANDSVLYFGAYCNIAASDPNITFHIANGAMTLGTTTSNVLYFKVNNISRWWIDTNGALVPSNTTGPYNLGTTAGRVGDIHLSQLGYLYLGDAGYLFSNGNDVRLYAYTTGDACLGVLSSGRVKFLTSGTERWYINSSGELIPTGYRDIGSAAFPVDVIYYNTLTHVSDIRLKTDIDKSLGLDFITGLNPVSYRIKNRPDKKRFGFIAQEVCNLILDNGLDLHDLNFVNYDDKNDSLGLSYMDFIAPIVAAIKELKGIVDGKADK